MGKSKYPIPDNVLIASANETMRNLQCGTDKWGEKEKCYCRELCGPEYALVETDWIGTRSINLRKKGCLQHFIKNGKGQPKTFSQPDWYKKYLTSKHWIVFSLTIRSFWGGNCCLCNSDKTTEVHHNNYDHLWEEEITDCVLLCRKCHKRHHRYMKKPPEKEPDFLLFT